ncbi:STAS domain-containing protein [Trujillonella humicola]|uniref:STAS domain-containing protein n=1 Tax=Trujillonella humicola TaxID=3383699 RepID=UPI003906C3D5
MFGDLGTGEDEDPVGSITVVTEGGRCVAHLVGDVDAALIGAAGGAGLLESGDVTAIDVSRLGYIDSTGLTMLVRWARSRARRGQRPLVQGSTPRFARVLSVSGLSSTFDVGA